MTDQLVGEVNFEEASLKRFDAVDYQFDARATSLLGTCASTKSRSTFPKEGAARGTQVSKLDQR